MKPVKIKFEFDPRKSALNLQKHGLSLEEATQIWLSPFVQVEARTHDEPRFMAIGLIEGRCTTCIFTPRGEIIRLISARRSREKEEQIYYGALAQGDNKSQEI